MKMIHLYYPVQWPIAHVTIDTKQVLAIGDFDGVHRGHRHVIMKAVEAARQHHLPASIMTFNPHPREVLGQTKYSRYLAPIHDKMQLFSSLGVDYTYIVTFDQAFSKISPEKFVKHMILPLQPHTVVVGFDFTYGYRGVGTANTLRQSAGGKFEVIVADPFHMDGEKVSSTRIREQLQIGRLDRIHDYLGRYYSITGMVVRGDGRGRTIGFPTANIEISAPYVIPRNGVYAVKISIDDQSYLGVMNIGTRPTFVHEEGEPSLEVHVLDFNGDLYGKMMKVEFVTFLRKEERFDNVDLLIQQINKDVNEARHLLSCR